jgi:diguanylate cyclase (GGDEF)-like protein
MRATTALLDLALDAAPDPATAGRAVVDHLARDHGLAAAVYLERGERLRCVAHRGQEELADGIRPGAGAVGRAFETGAEVAGAATDACLPVKAGGRTIGVLSVESAGPLDLEQLRHCAAALGARIAALGGPPAPTATERLLRHIAAIAGLEDPDAIGEALVDAALDLVALESAVLLRADARVPDESSSLIAGGAVTIALRAHDAPLGVLALAGSDLDTDDRELLEELATHAALALHTADRISKLRERAASDPLTGLGHHATFHEALAGSHRRPRTAVVLCDLDGFKRVNDTHGHAHGDRILCGVADAMSGAVRRGDRLFRIGGDEFAALLAVSDEAEALDAATRLRNAVDEATLGVTISIGVAVPREGEPDAELLARADRALYTVKASGRDGVALAGHEPVG